MGWPEQLTARCPRCGREGARILFGLPDFGSDLIRELRAGRVVLGGCVVGSMTRQRCPCGLRWRVEGEREFGPMREDNGPRVEEYDASGDDPSRWDAPSA